MDFKSYFTRPVIVSGVCLGLALSASLYSYKMYIHYGDKNAAIYQQSYSEAINSLQQVIDQRNPNVPPAQSMSGAYLSSLFAQRNQQWDYASEYMGTLQSFHGDNNMLLKKSILLDLGANNIDAAIEHAKQYLTTESDDNHSLALAHLLILVDLYNQNDLDAVKKQLILMPDDGLSSFMKPIFQAWILAGDGKFDKRLLRGHQMHVMNAAIIADFLGQTRQFKTILNQLSTFDGMSLLEQERLADMFYAAGQHDKARRLYKYISIAAPSSARISDKLNAKGDIPETLLLYKRCASAQCGTAYAIYNMAALLSQDKAHDSARIFINLALHLSDNIDDALILGAEIAAQAKDYYLAMHGYDQIIESSPRYFDAQLAKADVYEQAGHIDKAQELLINLYAQSNHISALIDLADLQRRNERLEESLASYNRVETEHLSGNITQQYWFIHYMRGMVLERMNRWDEARIDLDKALDFQPNHPFLLNYLGYAMTDRGIEIDKALELLERAMSIEPHDGYILDSVGWAYYRLGQYEKSVPFLERSAEIMPADATINDHLGDAYWQNNRRLEARYQWKRARNSNDIDDMLLTQIDEKLSHGLQSDITIKSAKNMIKSSE